MRVSQPGGKFYTSKYLRELCDLWDLRGSGITNMHGSTGTSFSWHHHSAARGDFYELTHKLNQDLGGSGSNLRTPPTASDKRAASMPATTPGAVLHVDQ